MTDGQKAFWWLLLLAGIVLGFALRARGATGALGAPGGGPPAPRSASPKVIVKPPSTNRYFLNLGWVDCSDGSGTELRWGTNSGSYPFTKEFAAGVTNGAVSNLIYRRTYFFEMQTSCTATARSEVQFPPKQPPFTNFVLLSCTGTLFMSVGLRGARFAVTNRLFKLGGAETSGVFWASTSPVSIRVLSNNQVSYGQFMHRQ